MLLCDTYTRPARCVIKFRLKFVVIPVTNRLTIYNRIKSLEKQIRLWAVREHAKEA